MRSGMRRQRKTLPEHYNELSGEGSITGAFIDYMELYHPSGLKLVGEDFIPTDATSTIISSIECTRSDEYILIDAVVAGQAVKVKKYVENTCQCTRCLNKPKAKAKKARRMVGSMVNSIP